MTLGPQNSSVLVRIAIGCVMVLLVGCAEVHRKDWGEQVNPSPTWGKFKRAAANAVKDPGTWVPALGAVIILASGKDDEFTHSAIDDHWLYDSGTDALISTGNSALVLDQLWMASMLSTDSGDGDWFSNKLKGGLAQIVFVHISHDTTNLLKDLVVRESPNHDGYYRGFPSNHAVPPFTQAALIRRNLRYTPVNNFTRYSIVTASYLLASGSAYGRVEGGLHYFSDQFAGAALGNFLGLLMYDAFFEDESVWGISLYPSVSNRGGVVQFRRNF